MEIKANRTDDPCPELNRAVGDGLVWCKIVPVEPTLNFRKIASSIYHYEPTIHRDPLYELCNSILHFRVPRSHLDTCVGNKAVSSKYFQELALAVEMR